MKGSRVIAEILRAEGTEYLFCFPMNPIIDAVAHLEIKPIMARTERTAVGMADGYTRVTGGRRIGVVAVQHGPGVENTFGGVAQAYSDSSPILVLPGGVPQSKLGSPPNFDAVLNFANITKWSGRLNQVERVPLLLRRAYTQLRTGRPGPVLLEAPLDVQNAELADASFAYTPVKGAKGMADPEDVRAAVRALLGARKPVVQAGLGVLYAGATPELVEFAELVQVPVTSTMAGKSAFPEDHPLALGAGGRSGPRPVAHYLREADLIFGIGSSFSASDYEAPIPAGKTAVQVTVDERDLNKDYPVDVLMLGDARLVLRQLIEEASRQLGTDGRRGDDKIARAVASLRDAWRSEWMPKLAANDVPINPYRLIWDVQQAVDLRNTIATHDAGNPRDQMVPMWQALEPNSYIGWGKSTHLGYGLALAMGAKLARPEKTVINIMGDTAFGMIGMDVETAARNNIGILTIVMNNGLLGGYEKHIPYATKRYGTRFITGNYSKVAEGLGAYTERIEQPDEIIPAVKRALKQTEKGRPALLEVITAEENQMSIYY
ncbi:MAG: thiamine pyrophosphate-requiring protein [Chloroflexota bacterium]